jgi:hypothetical protein
MAAHASEVFVSRVVELRDSGGRSTIQQRFDGKRFHQRLALFLALKREGYDMFRPIAIGQGGADTNLSTRTLSSLL